MTLRTPWSALILASVVAIAGCGSSSTTPSSTMPAVSTAPSTPAASTQAPVKLSAESSGALAYNETSLTASAGNVAIEFSNDAPIGHNVTVADASGHVLGATPTFDGGSRTLRLNLPAGTYTFYCSVPGHRMAGMQGTLVVK